MSNTTNPNEQRFSTAVAADVETVWQAITTPDGINREFRPWLRMTFPQSVRQLTPQTVPIGQRLCRSWILLFGLIPIDYDDVTLVEIRPKKGFSERSSMVAAKAWNHDRTLEPLPDGGCRVTDVVGFEPRVAFARPILRAIVGAVFRLRHRNLVRLFQR